MPIWDAYPPTYRSKEIATIRAAVRTGECLSLVGLSGAGKSNLLGYMVWQSCQTGYPAEFPRMLLLDCNRLIEASPQAFFQMLLKLLGYNSPANGEVEAVREVVAAILEENQRGLCIVVDRFDRFNGALLAGFSSQLRALRDDFKYQLTYVVGTRRPLDPSTELAELFYGRTLWLGPLSEADALWSIGQYAGRHGLDWNADFCGQIMQASGDYPALLRAVCDAAADGAPLEIDRLAAHPAVQARLTEFWADQPDDDALRRSGLLEIPLLMEGRPFEIDLTHLTAREELLLAYLRAHSNQVCNKDDLIRAVWSEDRVFEEGVRDDSLAQLVRRLREKIERNPASPRFVQTVPGRGYRYQP